MNKRALIVLFLTALGSALLLNMLNRVQIRKTNPENYRNNTRSLEHGITVWSIDNSWYLPYAANLEAGNGFTSDPLEPEMKVRRTPGYPLLYAVFYSLFGEGPAHYMMYILQVMLFACSACWVALLCMDIFGDLRTALICGYLYALVPFIPSFTSFTITEGISPALVVLALFLAVRAQKTEKQYFFLLTGLTAAMAFLVRPSTGILLAGISPFLFFLPGNILKRVQRMLWLGAGFLLLLSPWVIRNYVLRGELIVAEKYYHNAPMNYGGAHTEFRNLISCWTNPANLSAEDVSNALIRDMEMNKGEAQEKIIEEHVNAWPEEAFRGFKRKELAQALRLLAEDYRERKIYLEAHPGTERAIYLNLPGELAATAAFRGLRQKFISEAPVRYYILTPLKTMKEIVFNSSMHHVAMLNPPGGDHSFLQYVFKSLCYLLNVCLYLSLLIFPFLLCGRWQSGVLFIVPPLMLLILLCFSLFRYVESRYMLPVYPFMIITFGYVLGSIAQIKLSREANL